MDRNELIDFLKNLKVNEEFYFFDQKNKFDCTSLLYENGQWNVYYTEKDKPKFLASFANENEANIFVANQFKKDYSN